MVRLRVSWAGLWPLLAFGCSDPPASTDDGTTTAASTDDGTSGDGSSSASSVDDDSSSGEPPPPPVDCTEACADTASEAGAATCYSCRCLQAMDGWLPSPQELQCSQADDITPLRADLSGASPTLVPVDDPDPADCANPSLLTWSCQGGSRLGQINHDDVIVRWICRDPYDVGGQKIYADAGAIAHNTRTGATCFWDDVDNVTEEDNFPDLDLVNGDEANLVGYLQRFYYTEGDSCTECHDNDPFVYTPYLASTGWMATTYPLGPYALVRPDGSPDATANVHLVSPEVEPCLQCHRVGSAGTCEFMATDSLGLVKDPDTYEPAILDATDPASPAWSLAYWMPGTNAASTTVPPFDTLADWLAEYETARDTIVQCCAAPGVAVPGCDWEPIPGPR